MQASTPVTNAVLEGYLALVNSLSAASRTALIGKLSAAAAPAKEGNKATFQQAFGAFVSEQTAEQIIADLRSARTFTRHLEEF